jgi:hypothetical protein
MRRDARAHKRERHSPHPYLLLFATHGGRFAGS